MNRCLLQDFKNNFQKFSVNRGIITQPMWSFVCLQIFGPIMPFVSVKDVGEAINIINDRFSFIDCRMLFVWFLMSVKYYDCNCFCLIWLYRSAKCLVLVAFHCLCSADLFTVFFLIFGKENSWSGRVQMLCSWMASGVVVHSCALCEDCKAVQATCLVL